MGVPYLLTDKKRSCVSMSCGVGCECVCGGGQGGGSGEELLIILPFKKLTMYSNEHLSLPCFLKDR